MKLLSFSFFALALLVSNLALAAACCGGGFAIPSLITGDDRAQLTASLSHFKYDTQVSSSGVWRKYSDNQTLETLRIEGAHIFKDRYQAGFSLPIETRERSSDETSSKSSGLGDISLLGGYEYLPDWDYNPWRPHGVGFLSLMIPTGKSVYDSDSTSGVGQHGRGFWALGAGTALTKAWSVWDASATFEVHHSFERSIDNSQIQGKLKPGNGGSFALGSGYNFQNLRIGGSLIWSQEDPVDIEGPNPSSGSLERFASGVASASYLFPENWAGTLSYSDQTLFGDPTNASLGKTISLFVQKRWLR